MYFDNTQVSMASRDCEGGVYFFKTTIKKYWRVLALNGEPRILVSGGYIIKPYNVNSFDAYYMVGSRVVQVELETPKNDHVWIGTDIPR